jgi:hypothetical protein
VFGRDMIHNIAVRVNWDQIQKRKQNIINKSNQKESKSKIPYIKLGSNKKKKTGHYQ